MFISSDNGDNWVSINNGLQSKVVYTIFVNGSTIYAGTETGASVSIDNGLSWTTVNSGLSGKGIWSFAVNSTGDIIFAGTSSGIYFSSDNGNNWAASGLSGTMMPVHSIVISDKFIFAATQNHGIFGSNNNGSTWKDLSIMLMEDIIIPVYSLANIDNLIIAGSTAGNFYSGYISDYMDNLKCDFSCYYAGDIYGLYKPILSFSSRSDTLFAANSVGNFFVSKNGMEWKKTNLPSIYQPVYSMVLNNTYLFAGSDDAVWRLTYPLIPTNVEIDNKTPSGFSLEQNYPNPFNPSTKIRFTIPNSGIVSLKVYNILGELVDDLVEKYMDAGTHDVEFSPSNLESGIYFYSLVTDEFRSTRKLILLR